MSSPFEKNSSPYTPTGLHRVKAPAPPGGHKGVFMSNPNHNDLPGWQEEGYPAPLQKENDKEIELKKYILELEKLLEESCSIAFYTIVEEENQKYRGTLELISNIGGTLGGIVCQHLAKAIIDHIDEEGNEKSS